MPYHVVDADAAALNDRKKSLNGVRVLVLGVAYKKDVDDLRESPMLKIMQLLRERGAKIEYNDPYFPELHKMRHYTMPHALGRIDRRQSGHLRLRCYRPHLLRLCRHRAGSGRGL